MLVFERRLDSNPEIQAFLLLIESNVLYRHYFGLYMKKIVMSSGRLPLYVKHLPVHHSENQQHTEVLCGTSYTLLVPTPTRTLR